MLRRRWTPSCLTDPWEWNKLEPQDPKLPTTEATRASYPRTIPGRGCRCTGNPVAPFPDQPHLTAAINRRRLAIGRAHAGVGLPPPSRAGPGVSWPRCSPCAPAPHERYNEERAKQAALKADLARQVQEKRAADARQRGAARAGGTRGGRDPSLPPAAGRARRRPGVSNGGWGLGSRSRSRARHEAHGSGVEREAWCGDGGPVEARALCGWADDEWGASNFPPPSPETASRWAKVWTRVLSLAALLSGIQEQQRSLQEGLAGQAASMDRLSSPCSRRGGACWWKPSRGVCLAGTTAWLGSGGREFLTTVW